MVKQFFNFVISLQLKSTEFLNLDAILEGVLHRLVVRPLKSHLQKLFVDHYTKTGAIRLLADNIHYASTRPISELAIKVRSDYFVCFILLISLLISSLKLCFHLRVLFKQYRII